MTKQLQLRRGTTADHSTFTGALGEITYNTDTKAIHSHDGATVGGSPVALASDLVDFITSSSLTSTLSGYVTASSLSSTLSNYVTTASLSSYVTGSNLSSTLNAYVTTSSLTSTLALALGSYVTSSTLDSDLTNFVSNTSLASTLSGYVTGSSLTTTLGGYVTSTSLTSTLGNYATTSALSSYVTSASLSSQLSSYETTSALTTTLGGYVTSSTLTTTLGGYVTTAANHDIPSGGAVGQVLLKNSATNYDAVWSYPKVPAFTTVNASTYTLAISDQYLRVTYASAGVTITVPLNSAVAFPIGTQITIVWVSGNTSCTITGTSGVTILYPDSLSLRKAGSTATLTKVATDSWDFCGDAVVV